ncbi:hypothetical protein KY308_00655 [Candidatus Woesearchaeota archaeon]|nr:hypothetical protein [Candidatus Woesearchaeota archaeon]
MAEDMQEVFSKRKTTLEKMLKDADQLAPAQKRLLRTALEFGYSAAFCESRHDMQGSFHAAEEYKREYEKVRELLGGIK